ncbi:MAG TPA: hypothetical protein VFS43_00270 [Polyangiaceae bacterium]|nr:hypothetical protein [Polyangiaceae bacterium]
MFNQDNPAPGKGHPGLGLPDATAAEVLKAARDCPLLRARRLLVDGSPDVELTTAPTRYPHALKRRPEGYVVGSLSGDATVIRSPDDAVTPPADPKREIVLRATVAVTAQLLLY